jgi:hypothetical protein
VIRASRGCFLLTSWRSFLLSWPPPDLIRGSVPAIHCGASAGGDGRDKPHTRQDNGAAGEKSSPPAGGGWGRGSRYEVELCIYPTALPCDANPARKGRGRNTLRPALILMPMGTSPAMTV